MGPIKYKANPGNTVRLYCNTTDFKINNLVWGYVKKGLSRQFIW